MRSTLPRFALVPLIAWAMLALQSVRAVTLDVNLEELDRQGLIKLIRASLPEEHGFRSRKTPDLSTLAELHAFLFMSAPFEERELRAEAGSTLWALEDLMREECAKMDLSALRGAALGDGSPTSGCRHLVPALHLRLIETEIAALLAEPKRSYEFPVQPDGLPGLTYPKGKEALRRAAGPFAATLAKIQKEKPLGLGEEGDPFGELADSFLLGRKTKVADEILRFAWDSWCDTGIEQFHDAQMTIAFLALLRERRIPEALGASMRIRDSPSWLREPGHSFDRWRIDLLELCGFDWEEVLIASERMDFLAAAGSERAFAHALARWKAELKDRDAMPRNLKELAEFLKTPEYSPSPNSRLRKPVAPNLQIEFFQALDGVVSEDLENLPFHELEALMNTFEDLRRAETKPALRRLLEHPSTTFAKRASMLLNSMGENVQLIEDAPPVRFRLHINGEPWRSAEVYGEMVRPNGSGSFTVKTDSDGFASIPRDKFLDPDTRGPRVRFRSSQCSNSPSAPRRFDMPWVNGEVDVPKAFDRSTDVHLAAFPVPVEIDYSAVRLGGAAPHAKIELVTHRDGGQGHVAYALEFDRHAGAPPDAFAFGAIAPGEYRLSVATLGAVRHVTPPFTVAKGMEPVRIKLDKGCNLYALFAMPENARGTGVVALYRDGRDVTGEIIGNSWHYGSDPIARGLPAGRYRLRILSTAEYMKKFKISEWHAPMHASESDLRDGVDCEGLDVEFTVDDTTPAILDLGTHTIEPVASMKAKAAGVRHLGQPAPR